MVAEVSLIRRCQAVAVVGVVVAFVVGFGVVVVAEVVVAGDSIVVSIILGVALAIVVVVAG